ncbi:MAG: STAS domain-containing protein [Acidobacteriota bacterium]
MNIAVRVEEGVVILDLVGKLVIGDGDVQLREEVKDQLDKGHKKLLLNLQGVKTMDSSGLGELIRTKASANAAGATIKLLHVESKVAEVLEMTRLIGVFDSFNDEIDAIASFRE